MAGLTPQEFVSWWRGVTLKECSASQSHFIDRTTGGALHQPGRHPGHSRAGPHGPAAAEVGSGKGAQAEKLAERRDAATGGRATKLDNVLSGLLSRLAE